MRKKNRGGKAAIDLKPFRVMIGRVSASGKHYDFERYAFKTPSDALAAAKHALDKSDGRLREVKILVHKVKTNES